MDSHVEHKHDLFIKGLVMSIQIHLTSTHDLFMNELVVSGS